MRSQCLKAIIVCFSLIIASCVAYPRRIPPTEYPVVKEKVFKSPFERVWTASLRSYANRNLPIKNLDKTSGFLATEELHPPVAEFLVYMDPGKYAGGEAKVFPKNPIISSNMLITKIDDTTTMVKINSRGFIQWYANPVLSSQVGPVDEFPWLGLPSGAEAVTTGKLEALLFDEIEKFLSQGKSE